MSWLERRFENSVHEASLKMLRALVENHPAGVAITSDAGEVLAASARFEEWFAQADRPAPDPAERAFDPNRFRQRVAQIVSAERPVLGEELSLRDGRVFERDYTPFSLPGGAPAHLWEYRDITERRHAEQAQREASARLQFLVSAGTVVLYSCEPSPDYDRTFVSDNASGLLGYDAVRWQEPGFWRRALHPDDAGRVLTEMARLRERGCQAIEYRMLHENGQTVWVHDEVRQLCEAGRRAVEYVGCLIDISTRRQSENELLAIGRVAADVAHDFNNLLLVITGHAHLLKGATPATEAQRWSVEEIAKAVDRAAALTDRLLSAKRRVPRPEPTVEARRSPGGETVLVVEDEEAVRVFTGRALVRCGYRVLEATRGEEALEIVSQYAGRIAAVLTDVAMPGMSGCELVQRLAAAQPSLKVIFMSGYSPDDPVLRQVVPASSQAFLQKPFTPEMLATRLREVLDN